MSASPPPYTVCALYDYASPHEDDLNFTTGQKIKVTEEEGTDWLQGEYRDKGALKQGIFPKNYVERVQDEPEAPRLPPVPLRPQHDESKKVVPPTSPAAEDTGVRDEPSKYVAPKQEAATRTPEPEPQKVQQPVKRKSILTTQAKPETPPAAVAPAPAPAKATTSPPATAEDDKPVGSFRDRIAAFNRSKAAPIAPPPVLKQSNFVKKPFVPPPPSKNAYIPPVQQHAEPRREPELQPAPREPPVNKQEDVGSEEQPKVSSLKDRIALLQSMQLNPAIKAKKPPKPPPKKREDSVPKPEIQDASHHADHSLEIDSAAAPRMSSEAPVSTEEAVGNSSNVAKEPAPISKLAAPAADDSERSKEIPAPTNPQEEKNPDGAIKSNEVAEDSEQTKEGEEGEEGETEVGEEEGEEVDPEVARRLAIRERMMKMSGGMGMYGLMGPAPKSPYRPPPKAQSSTVEPEESKTSAHPPEQYRMMIPILPMAKPPPAPVTRVSDDSDPDEPSLRSPKSKHESDTDSPVKDAPTEDESVLSEIPNRKASRLSLESEGDEPVPQQNSSVREPRLPPPPPSAPPPSGGKTSAGGMNVTEGSGTDDEMSGDEQATLKSPVLQEMPVIPQRPSAGAPPPPPQRPDALDMNSVKRVSLIGSPPLLPDSPSTPMSVKRASYISRGGYMPPIPMFGAPQTKPPQPPPAPPVARGPPPPPPTAPPLRRSTDETRQTQRAMAAEDEDDDDDEEITEYEGDIDTELDDNKEPFKEALGSHGSAKRGEEGAEQSDETPLPSPQQSAILPPRQAPGLPPPPPPPPLPPSSPPKDAPYSIPPPPLPPTSPPTIRREGAERTRPISYIKVPPTFPKDEEEEGEEEEEEEEEEEVSNAQPTRPEKSLGKQPEDRPRLSMSGSRRSVDMSRALHDPLFQARDEDLGASTTWWTQEDTPPPVFQNRGKDLYYEMEQSTASKRGGRTYVTRDVYVLFSDYSQTVVTARFDRDNPTNVSLEQRHEPPPQPPRQDKLEEAWNSFGKSIFEAAKSLENKVVGDGNPSVLPVELIKGVTGALPPIGTKSYGVTVYQNLGNATIQQLDEIRSGDIITFRNAKFQGHKGGLHQKYSLDLSKMDHVGVVYDWDGTKKKLRIFEQGRESKKVKVESFRIGDLRSGEVKIWRVVGKNWVNW
ncbi:hypothetical protein ABW20_dc0107758 [Dactylellina cionopaga]|nr:hypothetical protein ABW20_dc0107758 [Dactylellina cionopaga]